MSGLFQEMFIGEQVEIVTDIIVCQQLLDETGHSETVDVPLSIVGFVREIDDEWVYLSGNRKTIDQAIPIKSVKHIAIVKEEEKKVNKKLIASKSDIN